MVNEAIHHPTDPSDDQANEATPSRAGRRSFLAAAGLTAGLAAALAGPRTAHADPGDEATLVPITIAELRAQTAAPTAQIHFVTDPGQEGLFVADSDDDTSPDNTGTVIVSAHGTRFVRQYDGPLNVRWFGAKGDGVADDTEAIQAAVDHAQSIGEEVRNGGALRAPLHIPAGLYMVSKPIVFDPGLSLRVFGDGRHSCITNFDVDEIIDAIFWIDSERGNLADGWRFEDLYLVPGARPSGGTNVRYGIRGHFTRSVFRSLRLQGFTQPEGAGVLFGYGWSNTFDTCNISHSENAIRSMDNNLNCVNIVNCLLRQCRGAAIHLGRSAGGYLVSVRGCTIEGNQGPAILAEGAVRGLDIHDCYFEANCSEPYLLKHRDNAPVHADIILGTDLEEIGPIRIANNLVNMTNGRTEQHGSFVVCHSASGGLDIVHTRVTNPAAPLTRNLLQLGPSATDVYHLEEVTVRGTTVQRPEQFTLVEFDQLEGVVNSLHQTEISGVEPINHCPPASDFESVAAGAAASLTAVTGRRRGRAVWELKATEAGDSQVLGFTLDLDEISELAGKYVYLACEVKPGTPDVEVGLWTSQLGSQGVATAGDDEWQIISFVDKMPDSGTVSFGIQLHGAAAGDTAAVAAPALAELGARYGSWGTVSLSDLTGLGRSGVLRELG